MECRHYNCIAVLNRTREKLLFCHRSKDPYKGLLNLVGGKIETGETSEEAAYRELHEETGIGSQDIVLHRLMDIMYYSQGFLLEIYVGTVEKDVELVEEVNTLLWVDMEEDFSDTSKYAGDKNIAHIVEVVKKFYDSAIDNFRK